MTYHEDEAVWIGSAQSARGAARIWLLRRGCVVLVVSGYVDVNLALDLCLRFDECILQVATELPLHAFCDYLEVSGADPEARKLVQGRVRGHAASLHQIHYAVPSSVLALAVQVASMFHGIKTTTCTSVARLDAKLEACLQRT